MFPIAPQSFRANGKLLLSGEYFVLDGAQALALPARRGQNMEVTPNQEKAATFYWSSHSMDGEAWFTARFSVYTGQCIESNDEAIAKRLEQLFAAIQKQKIDFFPLASSFSIKTTLEFPREWGLGTSSTLIHLLAQWAGVDPFQLLADSFGGSGYDIACAQAQGPILYQNTPGGPQFSPVNFQPPYSDHLYWVYLGKKQNSREGIALYRAKAKKRQAQLEAINQITRNMVDAITLDVFSALLEEHENLISDFLGLEKVKDLYFNDYWGSVKSLGAWGGDFVLFSSERSAAETQKYCNEKGFSVFLNYKDLIL